MMVLNNGKNQNIKIKKKRKILTDLEELLPNWNLVQTHVF